MIRYIFLIIIIIILIIFGYIKIKYKFWSIQPVFHIYDIWYYIYPKGIIEIDLPERNNKYNNFKDIETQIYDDISEIEKVRFVSFIQNNFLRNKNYNYSPLRENIESYLKGLEGGSVFLSFYRKEKMLIDNKTQDIKESKQIIGTMLSYPLQVIINNGNPDAYFNVYYVDYLCVDNNYRKKNIAPQLIQTHHHNQRHINKDIYISLFKREGDLTFIIPLTIYKTYGYQIDEIKNEKLPININVIEIGKNNIDYLLNFIKLNHTKFDIYISSSIANILELIKTNNIYVYIVIQENEILCAYYFKKLCTYIDESEKEVLTCYASINCCSISNIFINGFKEALKMIISKNKNYKILLLEGLSDNNKIIEMINIKSILEYTSAYYFYNFAHSTIKSDKSLIII